ncbi:MAG: PilZ domain-containing protein [Treponema sp.]|jgi:hypothetical protein|nr:PilZ domain-containing protein [Treponema sp.]
MWKTQKESSNDAVIFIVILVAVIGALIVYNAIKKPGVPGKKGGSAARAAATPRLFSGFTLHRLARNIGFNREQTKMLDFVLKTDAVAEPEKSLKNAALLDRHFRRAYRVIEQTANTEEEAQERLALLFSVRNILENSAGSGLTSTRQLQEESSAVLNLGKEKHQTSVLSVKGDNVVVECPQNALGTQVKVPRGQTLNVMVFTKNNKGFAFETRVLGYSTSLGHPTMLLAHSNRLKFLSQRRFRRRQVVIATNLFFVYVEGEGKKQRLVVDKKRLTGNITDISIGGCSVKTPATVQGGARLKIEFTQGDNTIAALGQVLRTNRAGGNTIMHVKFLKVARKSMNIINGLVYEYGHE